MKFIIAVIIIFISAWICHSGDFKGKGLSGGIVYCSTAEEIKHALADAYPGVRIIVKSGIYEKKAESAGFRKCYYFSKKSGERDNPILLCGEDAGNPPVFQGTANKEGIGLYITGSNWIVSNIIIRNAQKGIVLDHSDHTVLDTLEIYNTGDEGVHFRDGTSYAVIRNSYIHDTGQVHKEYGEGVYVGSFYGHWIRHEKKCDYITVANNRIGPNVTAEHIDYKEGSSYLTVTDNLFNAAGMNDTENGGTSFIDAKGNHALIKNNTGYQNGNSLLENAFEVHDQKDGWGDHNVFSGNTIRFDPGNTASYIVYVKDSKQVKGMPEGTLATNNIRVPDGNMDNIRH